MADKASIIDIQLEDMLSFCRKNSNVLIALGLSGIGLVLARRYFAGGICYSKTKLNGKTVIITGGNTGIGKETARDLARRGARVLLACRDITKAERSAAEIRRDTGNEDVHVRVVDLSSFKSVHSFCKGIQKTESHVDVLINNAGIMACPHWKSEDGYELQFATNHLGHFLLTNLLLDTLKKSAPSRIVNVSSNAHKRGKMQIDDVNFEKTQYNSWKAYGQSKLANILFTRELDKRLKGSGVSIFSLHPGVVVTELGRYLTEAGIAWYKLFLLKYLVAPFFFKNAKQGAQTSIYCAVQEGLEKESGKYFSDCAVKDVQPHAKDDDMATRLWDLSAKMTRLDK